MNENSKKITYEINRIINTINNEKIEKKLRENIKLYLYKIIFNINGRDFYKMKDNTIIQKYYLNKYNYSDFIKKDCPQVFLEQFMLPLEKQDINQFEKEFKKIKSYENEKFNKIDINYYQELMKKNSDILYIIFADLISPYIVETLKMKKSDILTKFWDSFCSKIVPKNSQKLFQTLFDPKTLLKNKDIQPEDIEMLLYSMRFCVKQ